MSFEPHEGQAVMRSSTRASKLPARISLTTDLPHLQRTDTNSKVVRIGEL